MLEEYELEFKVFTINRKKGGKVPLGIWEVSESDERRLDAYEGYPTFYRKEYIPIEVDGKKAEALIYIMNDVRKVEPPSNSYMQTCVQGYKDFGFDIKYLKDAFESSLQNLGVTFG